MSSLTARTEQNIQSFKLPELIVVPLNYRNQLTCSEPGAPSGCSLCPAGNPTWSGGPDQTEGFQPPVWITEHCAGRTPERLIILTKIKQRYFH